MGRGRLRALAWLGAALAALGTALPPTCAAEVAAGRRVALKCQACHGLDGLAKVPNVPHLAGQSEPYLVKQLLAYRSGARADEQMAIVARTLSDAEIAAVAAYYAAIRISVEPPDAPPPGKAP